MMLDGRSRNGGTNPAAGASLLNRTIPSLLLLVALWAAIYLPCLGTLEIKGEEGRRIYPGLAMLQSGDWLSPTVGGEPYANKPPFINWCIAAAVKVTGVVHEWSVRLPSALAMLALALGVFFCTRRSLAPAGAFLAAVFILTNIGFVEKGRLAEIESVFIACYGLAFAAWLHGEIHVGHRTWSWLGAGLFLGLGMLTKGPLPLLLFFYAFVLVTLRNQNRLRELLGWRHLACVLLTVALFLLWVAAQASRHGFADVVRIWQGEIAERAGTEDFSLGKYGMCILRSLTNFAPWLLLVPLLWNRSALDAMSREERARFVAMRRALVIVYLVVALLPAGRPRYTMPLFVPLSVLLAQIIGRGAFEWSFTWWRRLLQLMAILGTVAAVVVPVLFHATAAQWVASILLGVASAALALKTARCRDATTLALGSGVFVAIAMGVYSAAAVPTILAKSSSQRSLAQRMIGWLPADQPLFALRPSNDRLVFHVYSRVRIIGRLDELPAERPVFVLARTEDDKRALALVPNSVWLDSVSTKMDNTFELWKLAGSADVGAGAR